MAEADGLFVLPGAQDRGKKHPCLYGWNEYVDERPTPAERAGWRARYPHRNGMLVMGPALGRFCIDFDSDEAHRWGKKLGLPATQVRLTRRGRHYDFQYPGGFEVRNSAGVLHEHVDIRGRAGIAVAAGSIHPSGYIYRWTRGRSPQDIELAPAPDWLIEKLAERDRHIDDAPALSPREFSGTVSPWAEAILEDELFFLAEAEAGTRNASLARISFKLGQLAGGGEIPLSDAREALIEIARYWPNLKKSIDTIDRCLEAGMSKPRCCPQ
ncbi:MAG: bifunctional DNA primase/polymerase [Candidatus Binataceae bacterium]